MQQHEELAHGTELFRICHRERIGDQLGVGEQQRVDYPQPGRPQRPAGLGDLDDRVGDVGDLRLGRPEGESDLGAHSPLGQETLGERRVLGRYPAAVRQVLDLLHRRVRGDGEDDLDGLGRHLGVLQLAQADDLGARLLDPVATRHAEVEEALSDEYGYLLGPARIWTSSMRGSSIVAR